jgi:hypothetical protein
MDSQLAQERAMTRPIPVHCYRNGSSFCIGTGFVVVREGAKWLVTCVHIITFADTPNSYAPFEGANLKIVGTDFDFAFDQANKGRVSVVERPDNKLLYDVLAIHLTDAEAAQLEQFGAFGGEQFPAVEIGQGAVMRGFPGLGEEPIDPTTLEFEVIEIYGQSARGSQPTQVGMSGGPVTIDDQLVGICYADIGEPGAFKNALILTFHDLGPVLFS